MVCVCFGVGISFLSGDYGRFPAWWWRFKNFSFSLSIAPQYGHLHSDFGESLVVERQAGQIYKFNVLQPSRIGRRWY